MSGEILSTDGSAITLEANGASVSNGAIGAANDDSVLITDDPGYPFLRFALSIAAGTNFTAMGPIYLYERTLNVLSTNDTPVPTTTYTVKRVGTFFAYAQTATQYLVCDYVPRPSNGEAEYYIGNAAGQTISSGWTLTATPFVPAVAA